LSTRPPNLPDFDNPPVVEVALGVQLDPMPAVAAAHLGLLWAQYTDEFPNLEEHGPIDIAEEEFGDVAPAPAFQVEVVGKPPVPRYWFVSKDGTRLLQVQQDRFIHNWRRQGPATEYPRYEALRQSFDERFRTYASFVHERDLGQVNIRQAEITYVNRIDPVTGWSPQIQLDRIVRMWSPNYDTTLLADDIELVRLGQRHIIRDAQGPYARLYVSADPAAGSTIILNLAVRGRPRRPGLEGAIEFFDMGRDRIVRAFAAVTTAEIQSIWGRTQ
jgi:uncharacterized protein (TIGR04255 family)